VKKITDLVEKQWWYHGTDVNLLSHGSPVLDLKVFERPLNEDKNAEGPGWYWTSSRKEAEMYGKHVFRSKYVFGKGNGILLSGMPINFRKLMEFAQSASLEDQEIFLSNFDESSLKKVLQENYYHLDMHSAMVTLYRDLFRLNTLDYMVAAASIYGGVLVEKEDPDRLHLIIWQPKTMEVEL